jgi:integrase
MSATDILQKQRRAPDEGSVFPLRDTEGNLTGKWRAQVTLHDPDGKKVYRTRTTDSEDAGVIAKAELLAQYPDGLYIPPVPAGESKPGTIGALLDEWSDHYMGVGGSTADNYRSQIGVHLKPAFGEVAITDLKVSDVNKFLRTVKTKKRPPSTRERPEPKRRRVLKPAPFVPEDMSLSSKRLLRKVLAMALDHAISEDRLSENVARKAKLPKTSEDNTKVPDYFTTEEAKRFLAAAKGDRLYAAWVLQLHHGLRGGEVLALAWSDLDTSKRDKPVIHIQHGQQRVGGRLIARGKTKNPWSVRDIPISKAVLAILKAHKAQQDADRKVYVEQFEVAPEWNPDGLIFTSTTGTPVRPETYLRSFNTIRKAAKLSDKATPHTLRHTCITLMVERGKTPLLQIAKLHGHKDLTMLTKVYAHLGKDVVTGQESVLSDLLPT